MIENYEVVYDAAHKIKMTKAEVQKFLLQLKENEVVEFKGEFLTKFFKVITRVQSTVGRLHDGTKVVRNSFGEWIDATSPDVKLDRMYYPELANDTVMSEEEFNNQKLLK